MKKIIWINLTNQFKKSGIQIYNNHLKSIIKDKVKTINLAPVNNKNYVFKIYEKYISTYFKIIKYCKKYNTSYIILPDESYLIVGVFLTFVQKKTIIIIHDFKTLEIIKKLSLKEKLKYFILYPFFFFLNKFHYVVTVSKTSEKILRKKFKLKKITTIYNMFDGVNFIKQNIKLKRNNKKIILNVSNDLTHKNFFVILKSLKKLSNVLLVKIGKPISKSLRIKFRKYINLNNLNVKLIDEVNYKTLKNYYNSCDLYVNPSYHEGFGRTNIEALMCGKKVICSDIEINREILKKDVSYIKNFMSEDAWAKNIKKILCQKKKTKFINKYLFNKNKTKYEKKLFSIF